MVCILASNLTTAFVETDRDPVRLACCLSLSCCALFMYFA